MIVCITDRIGVASASAGISALGSADFANGAYTWNGSSLTAADVVDRTDWIGANGLAIPASAASGAQLLGDFAAKIATADFTLAITLDTTSLAFNVKSHILTATDSVGSSNWIDIYFEDEWDATDRDGSITRDALDFNNGITIGTHKIAVTRTPARMSLSVEGNAVQFDSRASAIAVSLGMVYLGGWSDGTENAVNIRSLAIYDAVSDADLPSLSA